MTVTPPKISFFVGLTFFGFAALFLVENSYSTVNEFLAPILLSLPLGAVGLYCLAMSLAKKDATDDDPNYPAYGVLWIGILLLAYSFFITAYTFVVVLGVLLFAAPIILMFVPFLVEDMSSKPENLYDPDDTYNEPSTNAVSDKLTAFMVKKEEPISLSLTKTGNQKPLTSDQQQLSPIDQAMWEIMNADTHLRSLMRTDPNLVGKIQSTFNYYDPDAGMIRSWARKLRSKGRGELLKHLNEEQKHLIEQAEMFENKVREGAKKEAEYKLFLAKNVMELMALKHAAEINQQAFAAGMMPEHYSAMNYEAGVSGIRETEKDRELERQKNLEGWRIEQNLSAAQRYRLAEDEVTDKLRKNLEKVLLELDELDKRTDLSERSRQELIEMKNSQIDNLKFRIKNREQMRLNDE